MMFRIAGRMSADVQGQTSLGIPFAESAEDRPNGTLNDFSVIFISCFRPCIFAI